MTVTDPGVKLLLADGLIRAGCDGATGAAGAVSAWRRARQCTRCTPSTAATKQESDQRAGDAADHRSGGTAGAERRHSSWKPPGTWNLAAAHGCWRASRWAAPQLQPW
ncbi:MAG: hypothetical protein ACLVJH_03110 [Faecalibacterium prausnitzii]